MYIAFDDNDPVYGLDSVRVAVDTHVSKAVAVEDAKRWHPRRYRAGETVDHSTLLVTVHWVGEPSHVASCANVHVVPDSLHSLGACADSVSGSIEVSATAFSCTCT